MRRPVAVALVLTAIAMVLSGCFGGVFVVNATSPLVLTSYAYDGQDGRELAGTLNATLYDSRDRGTIEATYRDALDEFRITWVNFTEDYPYQMGGVATELDLFGETGNGPGAFPRMHAYAAAWGTAEYYVDDVRQVDPHSLFQTMDAIFFVTQGMYRDNETRRIHGAEENRTYDPARPADSRVNAIGAMAVIVLYTTRGDLFRLVEFNEVEIVAS